MNTLNPLTQPIPDVPVNFKELLELQINLDYYKSNTEKLVRGCALMIAQRKKSLNEYNEQLKKKDATINSLSNILRTFIEKSNAANNYPAAPNQEFAELRTGSMNAKRPQEMCQEEEPLTKRTRSMDINVMNVIPFSQAHQEDFNESYKGPEVIHIQNENSETYTYAVL